MNRFLWLVLLVGVLLANNSVDAATAIPKSIVVEEGEGFVIHLIRNKRMDVEFDGCILDLDHKEKVISIGEKEKTRDGMTVRVIKSTPDECGIRVTNVRANAPKQWYLQGGTQKMGRFVGDIVSVEVRPKATKCPTASSDKLCTLIDKETKETKTCGGYFTKSDYDCFFFSPGSMEFKQESVVKSDPSEVAVVDNTYTPVKYEHNHAILECVLPDKHQIKKCILEHPQSSRKFKIMSDLATEKYSAMLTKFENGVCQFDISPPEGADLGLWVMDVESTTGSTEQCHFLVHPDYYTLRGMVKETVLIKTTDSQVVIPCAKDLYYPLTRCYLLSSDKTNLRFKTKSELRNNECEFTVGKNEEYTCGFNAPRATEDDLIRKFKVEIHEKEVINMNITTQKDGSTLMQCHEINNNPITDCLFLSPSPSETFSAPEPKAGRYTTPTSYIYAGKGFAHGHCAIRFPADYEIKAGTWKCYIQQKDKSEHIFTEMEYY